MTNKPAHLGVTGDRRLWLVAILGIAALGMTLDLLGYWPGVMIDDARWQYQQAVDNAFEDWHPPVMAWIWRRLIGLMPGPGPMLILQLSLYWAGFALIGAWAWHRGRPGLGLALAAVGWVPAPLALMGTVIKDALMAGSLLMAVGLLLWREGARSRYVRQALSTGALAAIGLAAALRFNAFLACVPLVVAAVPRPWIKTKLRLAVVGIGAALLLLAIMPTINVLLGAQKTNVGSSLIIFDLGGITENSGTNQFPDLGADDPVAANHQCYDPHQWDGYSEWAAKPCPLDFDRFQFAVQHSHVSPTALWIRAIVAHPIAYARHRLAHFNVSTWFVVAKGPGAPGWEKSADNPWGFQVKPNNVLHGIGLLAAGVSRTPLGWPSVWISIALGAFILGASARLPIPIQAVAASSFLFGLGYAVFGVATGMRYHLWTISGGALAAVLTIGEMTNGGTTPSRLAVRLAAAVVAATSLVAIAARILVR
jgi:hypothetical protein